MLTVSLIGTVGKRQEEAWRSISSSSQLAGEGCMEGKTDGSSKGKRDGAREGVQAVALSVPAHISSRRAGMRGGHSKPITKLIK